ncbi:cation-translocating P-type ATPase C-terminal domain-containing protein [Streptomyces olivaceoviridis]|uniref:cation-translocating P-type ATPase C-terminal domain-containing protein n=1 Tax=Streptomyces olivaceoviridis TaxID=1921 RepID=UPI00331DDA49
MDGPSAMALAVDPVRDDLMRRPPRDPQERILNARRLLAVLRAGAVMAGGTVVLLAVILSSLGHATAVTMSVHLSAEDAALFGRHQIRNRVLWWCLGGVLAVQVAAVSALGPFCVRHRPTGTGPVSRLPRDRVNGAAGRTGRVRRTRGGFPAVVARPTSERIGPTCAGAPIVARVSRKTARAEVQVFDLRQSHPFSMAKNRRLKWRQTAWSVRDP